MTTAVAVDQPSPPVGGPVAEPWPSWRYAWRLHRFRPARQLLNLAGVLLGWSSAALVGIAARSTFDHLATTRPGTSLGWLVWPITLLVARGVAITVTSFTLQATNGAFAYANAGMLQRNVLRRILQLPGGRALPGSSGEAISRLRDDTEGVIWWPIGFNNVIGSLFAGSIALVVMWRASPLLTGAVLLPLAAVIATVEAARSRLEAFRQANRESTASVTGFLGEVCAAAAGIQAADAQERVVAHLRRLSARRRRAAVRDRLLEQLLEGSFWVVNLGTGLALVVAGQALRQGRFSLGDLALFVAYLSVYQDAVRDIGGALTGYRQLKVSFTRLQRLLPGRTPADLVAADDTFERGHLPSPRPPQVVPEPFTGLAVHDLTYRHPGGGGVEAVSLRIEPGTFTVVTGRIGSGKSTLLQALLGLVPATGTISWNGAAVADPAAWMVPPRAASTPQVPRLFSTSLLDNLLLGLDVDQAAIDEAVRCAALDEDLHAFADGLATRIGARGVRLSGGQVQRTAAARMFVRTPQLLVCDDVSSALDVRTEAAVWDRALAVPGATVIAVSHRRAALARADTVVVLADGRLVDQGPLPDLLTRCAELRLLWRADPSADATSPT